MTLRVDRFEGAPDEWDAFVRGSAGWTHFHLYAWRSVIERALSHECIYLVARGAGGAIEGVLPLVRVRSLLFGHFLVSQPFVNYGGPLGSDAAIVALSQAAVDLADRGGVKLLELRSRRALPISLPVSHRKITVVLDLPRGNGSDLWKRFDSKVRSQIRRPQKEGVTVRFGAAEVDGFFSVFARHMRDLGTPTQSRLLFETIAETFGDDVWFGCAYLDGQPVAGGCAFRWGNEIEMTWASSLSAHKRLAPNMLLYWSFMERAIGAGLETFNFGRCSPDSGTHRFKRQWGSRDESLWWYTHSARGVAATPTSDRGAYAWGARMWRHLPIPLATAVGPHIVRCIP